MALEKLDYGVTLQETPAEVQAERADAGRADPNLSKATITTHERVTYGNREVEVGLINHKALGRPTDPQFERNLASVKGRVRAIGVGKATVVNFLPIRLHTDSLLGPSMKSNGKIVAPKDGEPYTTYVFDEVYYEPGRRGADAPLTATDWHPIQMANEFPSINHKGVFAYLGIPSDLNDPAWLARISQEEMHHGMTYGAALDACRRAAVDWMHEQLRHGSDRTRMKLPWTEPQKASARRLFHLGYIKTIPEEVEKKWDAEAPKPTICPKCQKPSETGASSCTNGSCTYVIDPKRAYEIGAITEDHESLERLTRAQIKEMGIDAYVAETIDEKPHRQALGIPKPWSKARQAMQDSQDDYATQQRMKVAEHTGAVMGEAVAKLTKKQESEQSKASKKE